MGFRSADATNARRMRRMRGVMTGFRLFRDLELFAAGLLDCVVRLALLRD